MNEIRVEGSRNVIAGSTVNANGDVMVGGDKITNLFYSAQYQDLKKQLDELDVQFSIIREQAEQNPNVEYFKTEQLRISEKRNEVQKKLDDLKSEVTRLAETFAKIPINTQRLKLAHEHFKTGDYAAARAVLDAEQMANELDALLQQKEQLQHRQAENEANLIDKANEFLILARLTAMDFTRTDRYEKTIDYFEKSLKAAHTAENTFEYAYFLQKHNQFAAAVPFYTEVLEIYRRRAETNPEVYLPVVAMTLNNLATLQADGGEFAAAQAEYEKALKIFRHLTETDTKVWLPIMATILNNLASLQNNRNESAAAQTGYEEALAIRRRLAETDPEAYLPDVARTLNNLSVLQAGRKELAPAQAGFDEALAIYRRLAETKPEAYLPDIAMTLNNSANLQQIMNKLAAAQARYKEALDIYRRLAETNPKAWLPNVAMVTGNISMFYLNDMPNKETSLAYARECLIAGLPFMEVVRAVQTYLARALHVVDAWGLDRDVFIEEALGVAKING